MIRKFSLKFQQNDQPLKGGSRRKRWKQIVKRHAHTVKIVSSFTNCKHFEKLTSSIQKNDF